jgi:hypothetical protein
LKSNGLNKEQAEGIMTVLAEVVEESINGMETTMVSKAEQEKVCPQSGNWHKGNFGLMGSNDIPKKSILPNLNPNSNSTKKTI